MINDTKIVPLAFHAWLDTYEPSEPTPRTYEQALATRLTAAHCERVRKYDPRLSDLADAEIDDLVFGE
jgi:hypothetical protein